MAIRFPYIFTGGAGLWCLLFICLGSCSVSIGWLYGRQYWRAPSNAVKGVASVKRTEENLPKRGDSSRSGSSSKSLDSATIQNELGRISSIPARLRLSAYQRLVSQMLAENRDATMRWLLENAQDLSQIPDFLVAAGRAAASLDASTFFEWNRNFDVVAQRPLVEGFLQAKDIRYSGDITGFFRELSPFVQDQTVTTLTRRLGERDIDDAIKWASEVGLSETSRDRAFGAIAEVLARESPEDAIFWAMSLDRNASDSALRNSLRAWVSQGATGELVELAKDAAGPDRERLIQAGFWSLLRASPQAALEYAALAQESPNAYAYRSSAFAHLVEESPTMAAQWLERNQTSTDYAQRLTSLVTIAAEGGGLGVVDYLRLARNSDERQSLVIAIGMALGREPGAVKVEDLGRANLTAAERETIARFLRQPQGR